MRSFSKRSLALATLTAAISCNIHRSHAFAPPQNYAFAPKLPTTMLPNYSTALHMTADLPDVATMRILELKKELESYGISTKSFLEKSELVNALEKARTEGKTPISTGAAPSTSSTTASSSSPPTTTPTPSPSTSSDSTSSESRADQLANELEKCKAMKAGELKAELESYGISTKSFFEKSEFVKACADARVDGASSKSSSSSGESKDEDGYAEYANVEVLTSDDAGPRKKADSQQGGNSPAPGGNPFGGGGGGGGMPDMGGMGGMADMLKNMGGMGGGGGGAPGGMGGMADMLKNMGGMGGGGMPGGMPGGGDAMKKAQELMGNPKVREIMAKAQSNPKVMAAMTECMGNPMAFAKYQNDPEIGAIMRELQELM